MSFWEPYEIAMGECLKAELGPLELWIECAVDEWRTAVRFDPEERAAAVSRGAKPDDLDWRRWAATVREPRIRFKPLLPSRSVIVRPEDPLHILPGEHAAFFVGIPLTVAVLIDGADRAGLVLCEEPTVQLSNTWFGLPTQGEPCFALRTRARRRLDEVPASPHRAVCPIRIRNVSKRPLEFLRLCLRVRHLNVYEGLTHLWTTVGDVIFEGDDTVSQLRYGEGPPPFDGAERLLGEAREVAERGFAAKAFDNLRAVASL